MTSGLQQLKNILGQVSDVNRAAAVFEAQIERGELESLLNASLYGILEVHRYQLAGTRST